jgi:hypothetical protein
LILGDGYTAAERRKFENDARRLTELVFATSPFSERRSDFNVWGLCPPARKPGISRPSAGTHLRSPLGAAYDAFGSERYLLTFENRAFRDVASFAPYDYVAILANSNALGAGGIFGLFTTIAADSVWAPFSFVHELGHNFADLADEYYAPPLSQVTLGPSLEPWEPNVTALLDPKNLKWKDLVSRETSLPTPWDRWAYEGLQREILQRRLQLRQKGRPDWEMDDLFLQEKRRGTFILAAEKYAGKVGAFEGAFYESKGYYRPEVDCIIFSRDNVPFCAVCRRAINQVIDLYSRMGP